MMMYSSVLVFSEQCVERLWLGTMIMVRVKFRVKYDDHG